VATERDSLNCILNLTMDYLRLIQISKQTNFKNKKRNWNCESATVVICVTITQIKAKIQPSFPSKNQSVRLDAKADNCKNHKSAYHEKTWAILRSPDRVHSSTISPDIFASVDSSFWWLISREMLTVTIVHTYRTEITSGSESFGRD